MHIKCDGSEILHYDNPDFPVFVRKNHISKCEDLSEAFIHWHDEVEFICVLEGAIGYLVDGERITAQAGEGIFVNSRHLHRILKETEECKLICVIFPPIILCTTKYISGEFVQPFLENKQLSYLKLNDSVEWQKKILQKMQCVYERSVKASGQLGVLAKIFEIWNLLVTHTDFTERSKERRDDELMTVTTMIGYVRENFAEKISLQDICDSGNIGTNLCTQLFKKYTNMSPVDYLRCYRIEKSLELLRDTDMTITEIAYATGFNGASYYAETFRKYAGYTPTQIRKRMKEQGYEIS